MHEVYIFIEATDSITLNQSSFAINTASTESLLFSLDVVVSEYEHESDRIVKRLGNRVTLAVTLILGLIVLEAIFIFYPLARLIQKHEKDLIRQNKRLVSLNSDLEQFIYAASHDLKTPIRGLSTIIQFMEEDFSDELKEKSKEYLTLIKKRVGLSYALIDGLMRYAAISRERNILTNYDLDVFMERLIEETETKNAGIKITKHSTFPKIETNPIWINEIFSNLIENAIKHNDKTDCEIDVDYKECTNLHEFYIRDNGKGVNKKYYDKIFKLFQTLENKENTPTAGIGLAIVKK
ncbi:MAG: hypothetical protein HC803_08045 [Saprospiraceae bacterium]|nr:hypothetical protein [Saprospiraceae bacterium]